MEDFSLKKIIGKVLLVVLPVVAAILLLYPTYRANELIKMQNEVFELAKKDTSSADSLARIENFEKQYGAELLSAKQNRLKLGLDLRGGMYVTLEVDIIRLLEESAQSDQIDDTFMEVLNKTKAEAVNSDEDVIDIFNRNFEQIAKPKRKFLSDYFYFGGESAEAMSEEKILQTLRSNEQDAIDQAMQVIRQRIDKYGIAEPTIQKQGARRILLELPGVTNEVEMRQLLQTTARLEFKLVKNDEATVSAFYAIDKFLAREAKLKKGLNVQDTTNADQDADLAKVQADTTSNLTKNDTTKTDTTNQTAAADTTNPYAGLSEEETRKRYLEDHPFTSLFETWFIPKGRNQRPQMINYIVDNFPKGDYNFHIYEPVIKKFNQIISRYEIKELLPYGTQILFSAKPQINKDNAGKEIKSYNFFVLKKDPELTGDVITDAIATYDPQNNQPIVSMSMNDEGSDRWAKITGENIQKRIAIVLDDQVYSAPVVQNKIIGGNSQITGMSDAEEAKLLKIVLKAGALKAPVQIIEERVVGPSLGEDSIKSGLTSFLIAILLVVLFMTIYYNVGGIIAVIAVMINVLLILGVLAAFQGTLTLPGIAGIILTIGMAVDANILIYERIREELARGRSIKSAIDEGFSKALSAILDSNITTFITGLILFFLGTGPIQGFAMTLMIGILGTLFTAIVLSKAMINIFIAKGATTFNFGQPKSLTA